MTRRISVLFLLITGTVNALVPDGLSRSADYYYSRQDYRQSLQLWAEVVKRQPSSAVAIIRLADLKLMIEGKKAAQGVLLDALQSKSYLLDGYSRSLLVKKLSQVLSTFISDEAQSFFLQARPKLTHKDFAGALSSLSQALALEPENILTLKEKAVCEKQLKQWSSYAATVRTSYSFNPFDGDIIEEYLKVLLYSGDYQQIVDASSHDLPGLGSGVSYIIRSIALLETNVDAEALVITDFISRNKEFKQNPLVHFVRAKALTRSKLGRANATEELKTFLTQVALENSDTEEPFFKLSEKVEEAEKLVLSTADATTKVPLK